MEDLWSIPGVLRIEGDSAWGLNTGRWAGIAGGGAPSVVVPSGSIWAALAEKKPWPCGGSEVVSLSLEEGLFRRAGEAGADGGPLRLGWFRTLPAMGFGGGIGRAWTFASGGGRSC